MDGPLFARPNIQQKEIFSIFPSEHCFPCIFLFHHLDSFCMKLCDFEDWKEILGTGKDFGDRNSFGDRKGLANLIRYSDLCYPFFWTPFFWTKYFSTNVFGPNFFWSNFLGPIFFGLIFFDQIFFDQIFWDQFFLTNFLGPIFLGPIFLGPIF